MDITYKTMDYFVKQAVRESGNIAICPMGECGLLAKQILNWRYGIQERFRIDNNVKLFNPNVIGVEDLSLVDCDGLVIILTAADKKVNCELLTRIHAVDQNIKIINILDPIIFEREDCLKYIKMVRKVLTIQGIKGEKELIRVGQDYDGGYIMLNDFTNSMHAYSFGIADDVSWEEQISENGIKVFMFDHTIEELPKQVKGGTFSRVGIAGKDDLDNSVLSMETILKQSGDNGKNNLLLKMDVEGAEWDFIQETSSDILRNFVQMTFEFHSLLDIGRQQKILDTFIKLNKTHQVVWVHANNCHNAYMADGLILPNLLEITYASREKYKFYEYDTYNLPMELDMPNIPYKKDIILGNFGGHIS